jgi:hypothetical protein
MESHNHIFLGEDHANVEQRTWWVLWLCGANLPAWRLGPGRLAAVLSVATGHNRRSEDYTPFTPEFENPRAI